MKASGAPLSSVVAVSGSGQQHGSAYFAKGARSTLRALNGSIPLKDALAKSFRVSDSPIWMDSSTTAECEIMEKGVGGPLKLAELTGSRAYERFTGSQILKKARKEPLVYSDTERISLVSIIFFL
jgi:xylulokinase